MDVYLASPSNQMACDKLSGMPVLMSYVCYSDFMKKGYIQSFGRLLIDSGAFSEFNTGKKIDLDEYADWVVPFVDMADAIAGLDDIGGDWRRSLKNYQKFELGFPTFHETDPPELLNDIIEIAKHRKQWIGIGLVPPRTGKDFFVKSVLDKIPEGIHVHGWALREYTRFPRIDSVDSTNWFRDAMDLRTSKITNHLTYAECIEIVVKRYKRWKRIIYGESNSEIFPLFDNID